VVGLLLLISYDLNRHERPRAYDEIRQLIESNAIDSRRPLYSQWFVQTNELPDAWSDRISEVADEDDNWFVVQVQRPYQGWLDHDLWTWLAERL